MIGVLQGDFGYLDIKYLKQNIPKCRSQISGSFRKTPWHCAEKYLKMSIANIWKLQENTSALCRKISQNVGRTYREASGEHRDTVQNGCETFRVSAIRGSGYVWPGKLKRPPLPSGVRRRMRNIRMECRRSRIPDVRHLGRMLTEQNSGCLTSG